MINVLSHCSFSTDLLWFNNISQLGACWVFGWISAVQTADAPSGWSTLVLTSELFVNFVRTGVKSVRMINMSISQFWTSFEYVLDFLRICLLVGYVLRCKIICLDKYWL